MAYNYVFRGDTLFLYHNFIGEIRASNFFMVWYINSNINQAAEKVSELLVDACYSALMFLLSNSYRIFVTYFPVTKHFGSNNSVRYKADFKTQKNFFGQGASQALFF